MQSFLHKSKLCQNHLMHRTQCHSMIVANIIVKLPKAIKSRKMQLSNIELYLTFHAHVSALDQLYSRHWHCDYCELNVLQQDNVATVYQPLCLIHMITVHKSCLISLTWWYGHWSTQENMYSKWLSANHRCESQVGLVSSVYKEWTLKDPWWCDAWSNVNGARHHPAQFWDEANPKCQRSSPFHPLVPSPPLLPPAVLYVSCNCRACSSSGHSGQTRETMGARREPCRWAADLLHSASAAFWGRASAKAQSLAEKSTNKENLLEATSGLRAVRMEP